MRRALTGLYSGDHRALRDLQRERALFRSRLLFCAALVCLLFFVLIYRYFDLQIHSHQNYVTLSDRNRIQVRPVEPNRGLIYDAQGNIIAENRAVQTLSLVLERVDNLDLTLKRLSTIVKIDDQDLDAFYKAKKLRQRPYEPVPLKFNLTDEELARVAVDEYSYDGLEVQGRLVRNYPYGDIFSHVVGYVARINEDELRGFSADEAKQYSGSQSIGKIGLEKYYEKQLHGEVGEESVETDARGRILNVLNTVMPVAGKDLHLFLRLDMQRAALKAMAGRRGSVVLLDVNTGGVLAMLSAPGYDPNKFVLGISAKEFAELNGSPDLPLFNRVIQGQYPPGSTIKPMLAVGALDAGVITPQTQINDPGYYQLENDDRFYRDWKKIGHGSHVDVHQAIVESCDVFFWDVGKRRGVDQMYPLGLQFGLGHPTGIDIPNEMSGIWPSREWKRRVRGMNWYPGNTLNMSIGQGDVLTTPIQLAQMVATIARDGKLIAPRLVKSIGGEDTPMDVQNVYQAPKEYWNIVHQSMRDVVHSIHGTAHSISRNLKFEMAGKTGTAQVVGIAQNEKYDSDSLSEGNRDHALFVAFAPVDDPKVAIAVVIENGEKSSKAALVAREVLEKYLAK